MDWSSISRATQGVQRVPRAYKQLKPLVIKGAPLGLVTLRPSTHLSPSEASELINFKILPGGDLCPRCGTTEYQNISADVGYTDMVICPMSGTEYTLFANEDGDIYYLDSGVMTYIDTVEEGVQLIPYHDVCIILDGGNVKYIDLSVAASVEMAYDDGTGTNGSQYKAVAGDRTTYVPVGNGTYTRAGFLFRSQDWESGYTLAPTTVMFKLQKEGNGFTGTDNVSILVRVRAQLDDSVLASATLFPAPIADLSADGEEVEVDLTVITEMSSGTNYYVTVEYSNGDATHYVKVLANYVESGAVGYGYAAAAYTSFPTANPIGFLRPGAAPKATFGVVHNSRLFVAGDPDNLGYVYYSNLTHLDWSTSNGGGYIGVVDDSSNSFPVGGFATWFAKLYVFGTRTQPFVAVLTGDTPSSYSLPDTYQRIDSANRALVVTPNDIWGANRNGLFNLRGVDTFGDMRASPIADAIIDRFQNYWPSDDVGVYVEYFPDDRQIWVMFPSYHRILVCHTDAAIRIQSGDYRYPWTEYQFILLNANDSKYQWNLSTQQADTYYLTLTDGSVPAFDPSGSVVVKDGVVLDYGNVGTLQTDEYGFFIEGDLEDSTLYIYSPGETPSEAELDIYVCMQPTMIKYLKGDMYIGGTDRILKMNESYYTDNVGDLTTENIYFSWKTASITPHIDSVVSSRLNVVAAAKVGGGFDLGIYIDNEYSSTIDLELDIPETSEIWALPDNYTVLQEWLEIKLYSVLFHIKNLELDGKGFYFKQIELYLRPTEV